MSDLLGLNEDKCLMLLRHFNWRRDLLENEWFGNEIKLGKEAGITPNNPEKPDTNIELLCPMCFDSKSRNEFEHLDCYHYICTDCFGSYIEYEVRRRFFRYIYRIIKKFTLNLYKSRQDNNM